MNYCKKYFLIGTTATLLTACGGNQGGREPVSPITPVRTSPATSPTSSSVAVTTPVAAIEKNEPIPTPTMIPTPTPAPLIHMKTISTESDAGKVDLMLVTGLNDGKLKSYPVVGTLKVAMKKTVYDPKITYVTPPAEEHYTINETYPVYVDASKFTPTLVAWLPPDTEYKIAIGKSKDPVIHTGFNPKYICPRYHYTRDFAAAGIDDFSSQGATLYGKTSRDLAFGYRAPAQDFGCEINSEVCYYVTGAAGVIKPIPLSEILKEPKLYVCTAPLKLKYEVPFDIAPGEEVDSLIVEQNQDQITFSAPKAQLDLVGQGNSSDIVIHQKTLTFHY